MKTALLILFTLMVLITIICIILTIFNPIKKGKKTSIIIQSVVIASFFFFFFSTKYNYDSKDSISYLFVLIFLSIIFLLYSSYTYLRYLFFKEGRSVFDKNKKIDLIVDYSKTIEEVIADGNYENKNEYVNSENFPINRLLPKNKKKISVKFFYFNYEIEPKEILLEMENRGYRPVYLIELLHLGSNNPELQKEFPLVALGEGLSTIPFLHYNGYMKGLDVSIKGDISLSTHCRFPAVKK